MTIKKLFAGILAVSMLSATIPALNVQAAPLPDDPNYLYKEDFEGVTYDTKFDAAGERWKSEVVTLRGNKLMKYTRDTSVAFPDGTNTYTIFSNHRVGNSNTAGGGEFKIESNSIYMGGFKIDYTDFPGYFPSTPGLGIRGSYGRTSATFGSMILNGSTLSWGDIFRENVANIDGFVNVEVVIETGDLSTKHLDSNNKIIAQKNATATTTVRYTKTNGQAAEYVKKETLNTMDAQGYYLDRFTGIGGSEWTSSTKNNGSFYIDDVYFKKIPTFKAYFNHNDGTDKVTEVSSNLESNVKLPELENRVVDTNDATYTEYEFENWYTRNGEADGDWGEKFDGLGIAADVNVFAKWLNVYKVKYDLQGGGFGGDDHSFIRADETEIRGELPEPTRHTYQFDAWYTEPNGEGVEFDGTFGEGEARNMTVYANWLPGKEITFLAPEADDEAERTTYQYPYEYLRPSEIITPVREGWEFMGWYLTDSETGDFAEPRVEVTTELAVEAGMVAKADWHRQHHITLELLGGSLADGVKSIVYTNDTDAEVDTIDIAAIPVPKKEGNSFLNWCTDKECTKVFDGNVTGDMTLWANYNDVLFYEGFEYEGEEFDAMNEKYVKDFNADDWEALIKEGAGIVPDPDDAENLVLRVPRMGDLNFRFDKGGPGLYEITFRMRQNSGLINYQPVQPLSGDATWSAPTFWAHQIISHYDDRRLNIWKNVTDNGNAYGWVNITMWYDTENETISYFADWENMHGGQYSAKMVDHPMTATDDYIDGVRMRYVGSGSGNLTNIYLDDYMVRKIDLPKIENIVYSDGKTGYDQKDVAVNSAISLYFDRKMDEGTITRDTVYLTTEQNGKQVTVPSTISKDTDGDKTVATIHPDKTLEKGTKYTINVSGDITGKAGASSKIDPYYLDKTYALTFTTKPDKFYASAKLLKADGLSEVETLEEMGNQEVQVVLNLRYPDGENASEKYFVGVELLEVEIDPTTKVGTEKQIAYQAVSGEIQKGGEIDVVQENQKYTALLKIPESVNENYIIRCFVWDTVKGENALNANWNVIELK